MKKILIDVKGLHKSYQTGEIITPVLNGINLRICEGEFIAIMGHSGAGKSTLMNILSFLDHPSEGVYIFENMPTESLSDDDLAEIRNSKVGFVFQMYNLLPHLSALENVKLPLMYAGVTEEEQNKRAKKVLEQVNLAHRFDHRPNQLSGGEQQRVAIARALINNPKIIFADEPTGSLDSKTSLEIMEIFCHLHNDLNHNIIMVTHERDIASYAERHIMLDDGKIVQDDRNHNRRR